MGAGREVAVVNIDMMSIMDFGISLERIKSKIRGLQYLIDEGELDCLATENPSLADTLDECLMAVLKWQAIESGSENKRVMWCSRCQCLQKYPHFCEEEGDSTEWQCDDIDIDEFIAGLA